MTEEKTYVFGLESNALAALMPAISNMGMNPAMLASMMNNDGFGNNGWWIIILLAVLNRNGFGGNGNDDTNAILAALNNDNGRDMLMSAINGNDAAINQLASTLNCDINSLQCGINTINSAILQVGCQVGMSSQLVINALQMGDSNIVNQLQLCCCNIREAITSQGYEGRIETLNQTNVLGSKIDTLTTLINDKFCQLEMREMQNKIDALRESNSTLRAQLSNEHQTAALQMSQAQSVAPLATALNALSAEVAAIKCKLPETVTLPANVGTYLTPCQSTILGLNTFGNNGFGFYNNGSIWS